MRKLFVLPILLVCGCASQSELQMAYNSQVNVTALQTTRIQPKSLEVDCSKGCGSAKITFIHHKDMQIVKVPKVTGTNDVILGVAPQVTKVIGWVAGAITVSKVVQSLADNAGGGNTTTETHTTTTIAGDDNQGNGASRQGSDLAINNDNGSTLNTGSQSNNNERDNNSLNDSVNDQSAYQNPVDNSDGRNTDDNSNNSRTDDNSDNSTVDNDFDNSDNRIDDNSDNSTIDNNSDNSIDDNSIDDNSQFIPDI